MYLFAYINSKTQQTLLHLQANRSRDGTPENIGVPCRPVSHFEADISTVPEALSELLFTNRLQVRELLDTTVYLPNLESDVLHDQDTRPPILD